MPDPRKNPLFTQTGTINVDITFGQYKTASNAYIAYVLPDFPQSDFIVPLSLERELESLPNFKDLTDDYKAKWLLLRMLQTASKAS